jgi:hypothetical protein
MDPIERSTFRVMITIVSPIARIAMIAAPDRSCCRLVFDTKFVLWIAVTVTTTTRASTIPSSRNRKSASASAWERPRPSMETCALSARTLTPPAPCASPWRRA